MNAPLEKMILWQSAFSNADQDLKRQIEELKQSLYKFRERISQLVSAIGSEFPGLTVHDITHLDALWHVAEQVTGSDYALNPAEAYVLGGAFLLHDAAHTAIAYPGGLKEIKETLVWQDLVAQNLNHNEPSIGSPEEKEILFQVLRHLHAEHAKNLALMEWKTPDANDATYLIESLELRKHYGHLIGEIAASHHWSAHKVAEIFSDRNVPCAAHLSPAKWSVDALKIALILRTADAAHLDAGRAPWFLFALRNPGGVSRKHWQFQAKIGQPVRSKTGELTISSGAPFEEHERDAWWLAYDTAKMVDHELRSADALLQQFDRPRFAAKSVLGISSSEAFARQVRAQGWEPVDVKPTVGNVPRLIARLGGKALYGEDSSAALKELLQNSVDAIHALRALGGLEKNEGRIDIHLRDMNDYWQLDIADTGIGMSRHVLTNVLLDFGTSFWSSSMMLEELPGLAKSGFKSIGKFGIGFYSAFMLTDEITITSRRFEQSANDRANQWQLIFDSGVNGRPIIREARQKDQLKRQGTRITLKLNSKSLQEMLRVNFDAGEILIKEKHYKQIKTQFLRVIYSICPSADTEITLTIQDNPSETIIKPLDWIDLDNTALSKRISCDGVKLHPLYNAAGTLLARVGFSTSNIEKPGIVAIQGITAGTIHNISGIMTAAGNNNNAARTDAIPAGTKEDWKKWAELFLATEKVSAETLLKIHPLMPEQDLIVFMIGSKFVNLEQLIKEIEAFDEIMVYTEHISHDWDDDISSSNFDKHFEHAENIVGIPHHRPRSKTYFVANDAPFRPRHKIAEFPWFLDVEAINYEQLFEEKISERWDLISTSEPLTVGTALNTEIIRAVSVYSKKEQ